NDTVVSGSGNDTLYSQGGNDTVNAGAGDDYVQSDNGTDTLFGGDGNDTIRDDYENDSKDGGIGDDSFELVGYNTGNDTYTAGDGRDRYQLYAHDSWNVVSTINDFEGGPGGDLIDLSSTFANLIGYVANTNPFTTGYMKIVDTGADSELQIDWNGAAGGETW